VNLMAAGTKLGWTLVGIVLIGLFVARIFVEISAQKFRRRSEALGQQLISGFHEDYNSHQPNQDSRTLTPQSAAIEQTQPTFGKFYKVESCQITGRIEPESIRASCTSVFERGRAEENFTFSPWPDNYRLTRYKATPLDSRH